MPQRGTAGAVAVLHTHNRRLDFHPHAHLVIPAVAFDAKGRLWRNKDSGYLFNEKALAKVFRAKMLEGIRQAGLKLPESYPEEWVAHCKAVGSGQKALVYPGRYLYRGVLPEKNIVANKGDNVTFRYHDGETRKWETRTLSDVEFLRLILLHVLPNRHERLFPPPLPRRERGQTNRYANLTTISGGRAISASCTPTVTHL